MPLGTGRLRGELRMTKMDVAELIPAIQAGFDVEFDGCMVSNEVLCNIPILDVFAWFERSDIVNTFLSPKQSKKDVDKTS